MHARGAQQLPNPHSSHVYNNLLTLLFREKRRTLHYTGEQLWRYFSGSFGAGVGFQEAHAPYTQGSNFIRVPGDATGLFETNDLIIYSPECAGREKKALSVGGGIIPLIIFFFISLSWSQQGRIAKFQLLVLLHSRVNGNIFYAVAGFDWWKTFTSIFTTFNKISLF